MNQREFIRLVAKKTGEPVVSVESIVDVLFSTMDDILLEGEKVSITKLGTFKLKEKKERKGFDPYHGVTIDIPASRKVVFESSKYLKKKIK